MNWNPLSKIMPNSDQKKGMLLAFTAIMFIAPDTLLIRLADIDSWNLIFYRGLIPFVVVFIGLLLIYKSKLTNEIVGNGVHGVAYALTFAVTNIVFVISVENTPFNIIHKIKCIKKYRIVIN